MSSYKGVSSLPYVNQNQYSDWGRSHHAFLPLIPQKDGKANSWQGVGEE